MSYTIVVIGGVAGGASAAAKARRVNEQAEILMFERGPYISFANCGLPYYIGEEIKNREDLLLQTPQSFWKRFRVQVKALHEVLKIDRSLKQVEVKDLTSGSVFRQSYDKLILAPGAGAIVPPLPGIQSKNIFIVKTVPDSDQVKNFMRQHQPKRAVVVGAGFIGLESAEALKRRGLDVTVVEMVNQVLPVFDEDMAQFVSRHLREAGIHLVLSDGVKQFHGQTMAEEIELQSGLRLPMDMAILSIGVRPELALAKDAGLTIGQAGGIAVNEFQQTSDPDIFAAGDAVEVTHLVTGQKTRIPLAGPANKQGRVAGANAAGEKLMFPGALGTAIVECMGVTAAKTGLSEREAQKAMLDVAVSFTHSADHAGYYPGSEMLHIKLVSEKISGRLLGAQIVGEKGVDKRIDVLATALSSKLKVTDLENLDLAYAPQFSSAKDPVVIAGFAASNILRQDVQTITCQALEQRRQTNPQLQVVDVRSPAEHAAGHLPNALLVPLDELRQRLSELDPQKETVIYCRVGLRGYLAARILLQHGFGQVRNLNGGILLCPEFNGSQTAVAKADEVSVSALQNILDSKQGQVWDVREKDEFDFEHIANTLHVPSERLSQQLARADQSQNIYVLCQSGIRSELAIRQMRALGFKQAHLVQGGVTAWKAAGYAVVRGKGPIPIMRQVQIVAGSLALVGGLFSGLFWLSILVGAGLIFAGISGFCGMAVVLAKMPWNKMRKKENSGQNACGPCK